MAVILKNIYFSLRAFDFAFSKASFINRYGHYIIYTTQTEDGKPVVLNVLISLYLFHCRKHFVHM